MTAPPFYSVILEFLRYHWFPPLLSWVLEPMSCQQYWYLVPSLFLIISFFWCFFLKSLLLPFRSGMSWRADLKFFSFQGFSSHLFKLSFCLPFSLSFFPSELIPSCQVESFPNHGSSFWVPRGTSLLFMNCWFPSFLIHFYIIGRLIGTYIFSFLVFLGIPFELS